MGGAFWRGALFRKNTVLLDYISLHLHNISALMNMCKPVRELLSDRVTLSESVNETATQSLSQSVNESVCQSVSQSVSESMRQSISESVNQ